MQVNAWPSYVVLTPCPQVSGASLFIADLRVDLRPRVQTGIVLYSNDAVNKADPTSLFDASTKHEAMSWPMIFNQSFHLINHRTSHSLDLASICGAKRGLDAGGAVSMRTPYPQGPRHQNPCWTARNSLRKNWPDFIHIHSQLPAPQTSPSGPQTPRGPLRCHKSCVTHKVLAKLCLKIDATTNPCTLVIPLSTGPSWTSWALEAPCVSFN